MNNGNRNAVFYWQNVLGWAHYARLSLSQWGIIKSKRLRNIVHFSTRKRWTYFWKTWIKGCIYIGYLASRRNPIRAFGLQLLKISLDAKLKYVSNLRCIKCVHMLNRASFEMFVHMIKDGLHEWERRDGQLALHATVRPPLICK